MQKEHVYARVILVLHNVVGEPFPFGCQILQKKNSNLQTCFLNIIFFSPDDLNIIKDGPTERRRFIDSELCQLDKIYLYDLTNYKKTLEQRNKLMKDIYFNPSLRDTLSVWDEKLEFIDEISGIVTDIHSNISGGRETLQISYEPNVEDIFLADELIRAREKDLKYGQTSVGPHRDDIKFTIADTDIRKFGSQGQQRTCALSLKLSEIQIVEQTIGEKPVLLLDDVLSELDSNRQNFLLGSLYDTQTIITCTGLDEFVKNRFQINKIFHIVEGKIADS